MEVKVLGFRKLDFVTKENQRILGTQIYAVYPSTDKYVVGEEVLLKEDNYKNKKLPFVPDSVLPVDKMKLGSYNVSFDINGGITTFEFLK